jgi:AraC family transcriptional regulator of adaptative response/methylated-DNA-[protein]-cysteine methyltransferase
MQTMAQRARQTGRQEAASSPARYAAIVADACRTITASARPPALRELARASGLSPHHFHRIFRAVTGLTPRAFADAHRAERTRQSLRAAGSITDAIYDAGFESSGRFYENADRALGMTPRAFRAGGRDMTIEYGTAACSLGHVLVAGTPRGICAVMLGDDSRQLEHDLAGRFPGATIEAAAPAFGDTLAAVVALIETPSASVDLPLDLHGTIFQQRVWQALRQIRPGETITYGELAERIGAPKSVRAVARACGANPAAVLVPCHRVIGRDGSLTGYRWGVARKRTLIERERAGR